MELETASWIRIDVHLHTKSDHEFAYQGSNGNFVQAYIKALKREQIQLGIITNHNKFKRGEFSLLKQEAEKEGILLLPGCEISVKIPGGNVHMLVVFDPNAWLKEDNSIDKFLKKAFKGASKYRNNNAVSPYYLIEITAILDSFDKDFFLIAAHVCQKSGLLYECSPAYLKKLARSKSFNEHLLGLQKVRKTKDTFNSNSKSTAEDFKNVFGKLPPQVEGSDPKNVNQIGKGTGISKVICKPFSYQGLRKALEEGKCYEEAKMNITQK